MFYNHLWLKLVKEEPEIASFVRFKVPISNETFLQSFLDNYNISIYSIIIFC